MTELQHHQQLTAAEARERTDEVKDDAQTLWMEFYALHAGDAHGALGYPSWKTYCNVEFGIDGTTAQRLLDTGRVLAELERGAKVPMGTLPQNERVARELAPVMHKAREKLADTWNEAVATAEGDQPTAAEVRAIVDERAPEVRPQRKPRVPRLTAAEKQARGIAEYIEACRDVLTQTKALDKKMNRKTFATTLDDDDRRRVYTALEGIRDTAQAAHDALRRTHRRRTR